MEYVVEEKPDFLVKTARSMELPVLWGRLKRTHGFKKKVVRKATIRRLQLIKNMSLPQSVVKEKLDENRISYVLEHIYPFRSSFRIVDFALPRWKIFVEVDGHDHNSSSTIERDNSKDRGAHERGWKTFRIKNSDCLEFSKLFTEFLTKNGYRY